MRKVQRGQRRKGSAMLESALVLTVFVFVLVGIVDFAQILYVHQSLTQRVRGVARDAVVEMLTEEQIRERIVYGNQPPDREDGIMPAGFMGLKMQNVKAEILDRTYNEQRLKVEVNGVPITVVLPFTGGRNARNLPLKVTIPLEEP